MVAEGGQSAAVANLDEAAARRLFGVARVARLATVDPSGRPHLVPLVFAVDSDSIYSVVDAKPKRSTALRRLANIAAEPRVSLLVDHYAEDWDQLWWARADGEARTVEFADDRAADAVRLLTERYPQYRLRPPLGPVLAVRVIRWTGWTSGDPALPGPWRTP
jgi:PPOX class probable F420-dependent enzyme